MSMFAYPAPGVNWTPEQVVRYLAAFRSYRPAPPLTDADNPTDYTPVFVPSEDDRRAHAAGNTLSAAEYNAMLDDGATQSAWDDYVMWADRYDALADMDRDSGPENDRTDSLGSDARRAELYP